ncbi:MAG: alcohol dehydrogenase catalytic domain-containing protein [candidate division WOR-3 bacterium]|nr:alcohol dehydrogenase catalytic domain-containing protein [candidate division WOR-3 bacterium]
MKAIVKTTPQPGVTLTTVPVPEIKSDEVLVKVKACGICGTDIHIYNWDKWAESRIGFSKLPQIIGHEFSGIVEKVGKDVKGIKVGDYVSAETHIYNPKDLNALLGQSHIGDNMEILGVDRNGVFAEYVAVPERVVWHNKFDIPYELAAIQEPLGNACYAVLGEDGDIAGKSMVITGDGPISLMAVAIARTCGVAKIFLIGMSEPRMELAQKLGADYVLSVNTTTHEERIEFIKEKTYGAGVDIALEIVGNQKSIADAFKSVRKGGRVSAFGISPQNVVELDYNNDIVFKGIQIHGISGRKIFDTWYRVHNLLSTKRLNIYPVITDLMLLDDYNDAFNKLTHPNRSAAKIVLFLEKKDLDEALKRKNLKE